MSKNSNSYCAGIKTKHGKKFLSILLSVIMIGGCFCTNLTAFAAGDIASGNLTDTITWKIDSNGVLRVSGAGAIPDSDFNYGKVSVPWYDYNDKITGIVIGNGITEIGACAFAFFRNTTYASESSINGSTDNWRLTQLSLPSSLTRIGASAFCETYFDCNLVIPNSVTVIENGAFQCNYGAFEGHTLTLSSNITRIEGHTFMNCHFTGTLTLPNGLTGIYDDNTSNLNDCYAFSGNDFTGTLTIPASVTYIGKSAFELCKFSEIKFASGSQLQNIGDYAFYENHNLRGTLSLPNGLKTIGNYAFENCTSCTNAPGHENQGLTGNLVIPSSVTSIGKEAFYGNYWLNGRLTINNSNTTIGQCAFHGCAGWTSSISNFFQNRPDLVYVKRGYLVQGKDGLLDSNTSVEDPSEYYYYVYCSGCDNIFVCTNYSNVSGLINAGRLRSARSVSLVTSAPAQNTILPVYEFVERVEPTYDSVGIDEHYIDEDKNCFILRNGEMVQVSEESLMVPALIRIENITVSEEITVEVGKNKKIELSVQPSNANINGITFISNDNSIATVNSVGIVKGVSAGETTITVNAPNGISKTVSISVIERVQRSAFSDLISEFFNSIISFFLSLFSF